MNRSTLQSEIIGAIQEQLGPNISIVKELAELLHISKDSAYRRIRGEKYLDIKELQILATHFQISLDDYLYSNSNVTGLRYQIVGSENLPFADYLNITKARLEELSTIEDSYLSWIARDLPILQSYRFDELTAFKILYWHKFFFRDPKYVNVSFDFENLSKKIQSYLQKTRKIWELYSQIDSEEVWFQETPFTTLRQILYCYESGVFKKSRHVLLLLKQLKDLLLKVQEEARIGKRVIDHKQDSGTGGKFDLYINEDSIGSNTVLGKFRGKCLVYITSDISFQIQSSNLHFCDLVKKSIEEYKNRSTLVSKCSEKERLKFFNDINQKMDKHIDKIKDQI